jgi:PKD repeat protein
MNHVNRRTFLKSSAAGLGGLLVRPSLSSAASGTAETLSREAKDTLTALEMNRGDTLQFKLRNGQVRTFVLEGTDAAVVLTNLKQLKIKVREDTGRTIYRFSCRIRVDGHPITLERYVSCQEAFYVPYVINGVRLWLDGVKDIFKVVTDTHGGHPDPLAHNGCVLNKDARFALNDMTDSICPVELRDWFPLEADYLDIRNCYNGDDCFLGAYNGADCHYGLDIDMPKGTPIFAPIDFDDQYLYNAVARGSNNNRWAGLHRWSNGDTWTLLLRHLIRLLVPEHTLVKAGVQYAEGAGVYVGSHNHSDFGFEITEPGKALVLVDPWILFWQMFEQHREKADKVKAMMAPLSPGQSGMPVAFSSAGSHAGKSGGKLSCYWTFGDGGWSNETNPWHTFLKPGIYPVTLTVDDGQERAALTQHITIDGKAAEKPGLVLEAPQETGFVDRGVSVLDVYAAPVRQIPHTLEYSACEGCASPQSKIVLLKNAGKGVFKPVFRIRVIYERGSGWLKVSPLAGSRRVTVTVDPKGLTLGAYAATVLVYCPGVLNSPQGFRVALAMREPQTSDEVTVDNADSGFYCTPYFWVGPRFQGWSEPGYNGFYLTNGERGAEGQFARFTPFLRGGTYEVRLAPETPFHAGTEFSMRVKDRFGIHEVRVQPDHSRVVGHFTFGDGTDGFAEILAAGSRGPVLADAIIFKRVGPASASSSSPH